MLEALLYVCVCVCPLITAVSCARADKPIEVLFGVWTGVGQRNHVGARIPPGEGEIFWRWHLPTSCKLYGNIVFVN